MRAGTRSFRAIPRLRALGIELDGCDAVVNLAGQNIFGERWNAQVKRKIRDSRVHGTENVVAAIARAEARPKVLVQGVGDRLVRPHEDEALTEEQSRPGSDFMAIVCREWEEAAHPAEAWGCAWPRSAPGSSWPKATAPSAS